MLILVELAAIVLELAPTHVPEAVCEVAIVVKLVGKESVKLAEVSAISLGLEITTVDGAKALILAGLNTCSWVGAGLR